MLSRILIAVLNGIITFVVLTLIVAVLEMVGFSAIGVLSPFILAIAVIVGLLTFLGAIPDYWNGIIR